MGGRCQKVTITSVFFVKCIKNTFVKTLFHNSYEIKSWSKRQNDKTHRNVH